MTCCFACSGAARASPAAAMPEPAEAAALGGEPELPAEVLSAGLLLHRAFDLFRLEQDARAADAFAEAIGTGNLNDAGRSLAYWHIFVAEQHLGHDDRAADALGSFVVVAQDVLDERPELTDQDDFIVRFDLTRRLARARATLSAVWAAHASLFGRRVSQPVLVHDDVEKDYFLQLAVPCARSQERQIVGQGETRGPTIEQVSVRCGGPQSVQQSYYFQTVEDTSP